MSQSEFNDAFYGKFWVSYKTFRTTCIDNMGELEKMLEAEEAEFNEIEKLKREREQIEKDMQLKEQEQIEREKQLKEQEQIERERQLKETGVIERETDKDNQTEEETVNEGNASDTSLVFTGSDSSSEQQGESSSPRYDSDADGTQQNEDVWDTEDDHFRPSSDTVILATIQHLDTHDSVDIFANMFVHDQTHPAHPESISDIANHISQEMVDVVVLVILAKFGGKLIVGTCRHLGYLVYYKNYIETLKEQVKKLKARSQEVNQDVEEARRNGEIVVPGVYQWIKDVEIIYNDSSSFLNIEVQEGKSKCTDWFLNIKKRYTLSKKAKKKTDEVTNLTDARFNKISNPTLPLAVGERSTQDYKIFESRIPIMNQLIKFLKDESKHIISICGMGGSGKTTMVLKEVSRRGEWVKFFDEIIMAVVSKEHNLVKVQEDLAEWLGFKFKATNMEGRANELWKRLLQSKKGNLVILDDVWKNIDWDKIGIPFGEKYNNCKVILTSRSQDACNAMGCHDILTLDTLTESETWSLLGEIVGDSLQHDSELCETASKISKRCGGLPSAVVCLGRALKDKRKEVWNDTLKKLQNSMVPENIEGVKEYVYQSLQVSYDLLEDVETKKIFLLCCVYPEYANIPLEALVRCGMGLDFYKGVEFFINVRDRVHTLIDKLRSRFLLLSGDRKSTVKVHIVLLTVGISVASMLEPHLEPFSAAVVHEDRWPKGMKNGNYSAVSVVSNEISELPPDGLSFHKVELLQLACPKLSLEKLKTMFGRMKVAKVFEIWNMSLFSLSSFLDSLPREMVTLCMNCNIKNIGDIKAEEFVKLEILSLGNSYIKELPEQMGRFTKLRLLDMSSCRGLERISPGVISSLTQLEELDTGSKLWGNEEESDARLTELDSLEHLIYLGIHIKSIDILLQTSIFGKLKRYVIDVGVHLEKARSFSNRMLLLRLENTKIPLGGGIDKLLRKTTEKVFLTGDGMKMALEELVPSGFQQVKTLTAESCNSAEVEYLSDSSYSSNEAGVFSNLEKLSMEKIWHLKGIIRHDDRRLPDKSFSRLRKIRLYSLPEMTHLFTQSVAVNLVHLESLHVEYCTIMKQVILNPRPTEPSTFENKIMFPRFTELVLNDVSNLVCFSHGINLQIEFPLLKVLKLEYLQNFHAFCPEEINLANMVNYKGNIQSLVDDKVNLSSLAELTITNIGNIKYVWCGYLENLVHLQGLYIQFCQYDGTSDFDSTALGIEHVEFPLLRVLRLCWLTHFKSFCSEDKTGWPSSVFNDKVMFPSLETLEISELDSVEELWPNQLQTSQFCKLKSLRVEKCQKLVSIFKSDLQALFPSLEKLEVEKCDLLKEVWSSKAAPIRNLKDVLVYDCPKLRNMCSCSTFKGLSNLMSIDISCCKTMEAVVSDEHKDYGVLSVDKLEQLKLELLPNLNSFSPTKCDMELPELRHVIVNNCPDIHTFSGSSSITTPKLEFAVVDNAKTWLGDLNKTMQRFSKKEKKQNHAAPLVIC
ncbi:AAA+ ATPase domain-containing protein [Artemisia annua]|uniref:AAA+ ATPase domain-containing protein n=1 Tax=Artemisia annua TaxID=35608 RepID=A0A2U1KZ76_ARTAN|nr:AAA+ ATPase domain-containing protein [Artemisia annua]